MVLFWLWLLVLVTVSWLLYVGFSISVIVSFSLAPDWSISQEKTARKYRLVPVLLNIEARGEAVYIEDIGKMLKEN
jgi:hypothetical protein